MIGKNIDQITEQDLQDLVYNSVLESKTIEYKQSLPGNSDSEKKEFLKDVSSFANASGGDLIYGISEDRNTGTPKSLDGLAIQNIDSEISRLLNIIRDGIEPRISSIQTQYVRLSDSHTALIIRVPRSWNIPHRVIFQGHDRFYGRNSNGKYPLDVGELRTLFNLSATLAEQIKRFRENRISSIIADESFVPLTDDPKMVVHLIPMISLNPGQKYDFGLISNLTQRRPMDWGGGDCRYNLDGFLTHSTVSVEGTRTYVQLYRNGIIEAVKGQIVSERGGRLLIVPSYGNNLIELLTHYLPVLSDLTVELPIFLFLSLLGVRGYSMDTTRRPDLDSEYAIDRDMLLLPEVIIERYDTPAEVILKPCFDSVWNACGFARCPNYDKEGKWLGQ